MGRIRVSVVLIGASLLPVSSRSSDIVPLDADGRTFCPDNGLCWGGYIVQDWGRGACSVGDRIATTDDCDRALAEYRRSCGGRDREAQRETWDGPTGCHVQDAGFMEFQFNLNKAQGRAPAHAPVCLGAIDRITVCYQEDPSVDPYVSDWSHYKEKRWDGDAGYGRQRDRSAQDGIGGLISIMLLLIIALAATVSMLLCCRLAAVTRQMQSQPYPPTPLPMTSMQVQEPPSVFVILPLGVVAGQTFEVQTAHGRVQARVPPGVQPGQTIQVQVTMPNPIPNFNVVIGRPIGPAGVG